MDDPLVGVYNVTKRYAAHTVVDGVSMAIRQGEFFSLLGGSGCGKSTTLRMIAGFEVPDAGEIRFAGASGGKDPAYVKRVNMVFQNYALFPHMTVAENIGFGLKMQQTPRAQLKRRVGEMLELVQLEKMENRLPRELSGGQQQRVALARALATNPQIVLLDEPLGALDLKLRKEMQHELKNIQQTLGSTFIYVTHDQEEALTMSDRICIMNAGRVEQIGTPEDVYQRPQSRFVAEFIGESNFLTGKVSGGRDGRITVQVGSWAVEAVAPDPVPAVGSDVVLAIRPERIQQLGGNGPASQNVVHGEVQRSIFCGSDRLLAVKLENGTNLNMRQQAADAAPVAVGTRLGLCWPADAMAVITT